MSDQQPKALSGAPYEVPLHNGVTLEINNGIYRDGKGQELPAIAAKIHGPRRINNEAVNAAGFLSLQTIDQQISTLQTVRSDVRRNMARTKDERLRKQNLSNSKFYELAYALWASDYGYNYKLDSIRTAWIQSPNAVKRQWIRLARTATNYEKRKDYWAKGRDTGTDHDTLIEPSVAPPMPLPQWGNFWSAEPKNSQLAILDDRIARLKSAWSALLIQPETPVRDAFMEGLDASIQRLQKERDEVDQEYRLNTLRGTTMKRGRRIW